MTTQELSAEELATVQRFDDADILDALEADMAQIGAVMALGPIRGPLPLLVDMIERNGAQNGVQPYRCSAEIFDGEVA